MKNYIGITIGPIERVCSYAKKTRGIWASSYLFSYIARNIVEEYFKNGRKFIKPTLDKDMFDIKNDGVGRFPDQYIFEKNADDSLDELRAVCNEKLDALANDIALITESNADIVKKYLRRTIKIIIFEQSFDDEIQKEEVVHQMQETMNIMECRDSYVSVECEKENFLERYIERVSKKSILVPKRFSMFKSILECASCGQFTEDDHGNVLKIGSDADDNLEPYQKYIAVVCGDGDNFGKTLARHGDKVSGVFKVINETTKNKIQDYKGQLIYQGGDDLYFIAPVYNPYKKMDIFGLVKEISDAIQNEIEKVPCIKKDVENDPSVKPSMSFGVSMSYYKFPIAETRQKANDLLYEIKNVEAGQLKNKINWCMRKHSGQTFKGIIDKNNVGELEKFINFVGDITINKEDKSVFLHSVTYWLVSDAEMLKYILKKDDRETLLKNYRKANFNEDEHKKYNDFLDKVVDFLLENEEDEGLEKLASILRYISLLLKDKE